jgi:hypothetical protein
VGLTGDLGRCGEEENLCYCRELNTDSPVVRLEAKSLYQTKTPPLFLLHEYFYVTKYNALVGPSNYSDYRFKIGAGIAQSV